MTGWKTAEVTRKEVPDQKASMAVPRSFSVMMGRAILREVASRAAARVIMQMLMKAKRKPLPGLKAGWKFSKGAMAGFGAERDRVSGEEGVVGEGLSSRDDNEVLFGDDIVVGMKGKRASDEEGCSGDGCGEDLES
jgi:hypothetical protein